jgi:isopenicillin N synthase-like dioxygenase
MSIPVIDISSSKSVLELSEALKEIGFCYIKNHGISLELQNGLFQQFRSFFDETLNVKTEIAMKHAGLAWRGYFPLGGELTSGRPDQKEGIYYGLEGKPGLPMHGKNLWPAGSKHTQLKPSVLKYIDETSVLGHHLMGMIAQGLSLPRNYFRTRFTDHPMVLFRAFNYPKHVWTEQEDEWGVREHTDYGFLTILLQDNSGGLQVRNRAGKWIEAPPIENTFVINIGDMLEVWTHGIYRSTPHRVRNLGGGDRISLPLFFDPAWTATLEPIDPALLPKKMLESVDAKMSDRWDGLNLAHLSRDLTYGNFIWEKVKKVFPELSKGS